MKKYLLYFSYLLVVIVLVSLFSEKIKSDQTVNAYYLSQNQQADSFDEYFLEAVSYWPKGLSSESLNIKAGVIPHHLPASPMIANFFSRMSNQKVGRIFILAPNHDEAGNCSLLFSESSQDLFSDFTKQECFSNEIIQQEHAIATVVPFIDYYLTDVEVIPILVSNYTPIKDIDSLVEFLNKSTSDEDVFVASVDFSHYLSYEEALKNDSETIALMKEKNHESMIMLDHENLDSPESVITLIKLMEAQEINDFSIIAHENFVSLLEDKNQASTSYFEIMWQK